MIRSNLSTRPFYNERAVALWLTLLAIVAAAATAFNVSRIVRYAGGNTELIRQASQNEQRAAEIQRAAAELRSTVDARQIDEASLDARQANDLIDRRTFSWTDLFNRFEATLPDDVRITSVQPFLDGERQIHLTIVVLAQSVDDVNEFMERLDRTGVFVQLRSTREQINDQDQIESVLETVYAPAPASEPASSTASAAGTRPR